RFVARQSEAAFLALGRRHGPLVLGVCRRLAGQEQDAEDAFQATSLVLVRKAGSIGKAERLASWLYGGSARAAVPARARAALRFAFNPAANTPPAAVVSLAKGALQSMSPAPFSLDRRRLSRGDSCWHCALPSRRLSQVPNRFRPDTRKE